MRMGNRHQDPGVRFGTDKSEYEVLRSYEWDRKAHQNPGARFAPPERATRTREYDLLRIRVGKKEPPRPGSTICYRSEWARKSRQEPGVRFVTDKSGQERATKTREYDLLWIRRGQKDPPRAGGTI